MAQFPTVSVHGTASLLGPGSEFQLCGPVGTHPIFALRRSRHDPHVSLPPSPPGSRRSFFKTTG